MDGGTPIYDTSDANTDSIGNVDGAAGTAPVISDTDKTALADVVIGDPITGYTRFRLV